jgi:hypothetical protein
MIPITSDNTGNLRVSGIERRLTLQLMSYWERIRGARAMPRESDVNPDELNDLWDDCFLVHASNLTQDDYNFVYLGDNIRMALSGGVTDDPARFAQSLNVKRLSPSIAKALKSQTPVIEEGELLNDLNQLVKYRQCLLPLGDGEKVLAVFGGMRCKVYGDEPTIQ